MSGNKKELTKAQAKADARKVTNIWATAIRREGKDIENHWAYVLQLAPDMSVRMDIAVVNVNTGQGDIGTYLEERA